MLVSMVLVAAVQATSAQPPSIECQVVQALFTQERAEGKGRYVGRVVPSTSLTSHTSPQGLVAWMPILSVSLDVPSGAAKELAAKVLAQRDLSWRADCAWTSPPVGFANAFTRPVVSADGRLAIMEWSSGLADPTDVGEGCLAYRPEQNWTVRCITTWQR